VILHLEWKELIGLVIGLFEAKIRSPPPFTSAAIILYLTSTISLLMLILNIIKHWLLNQEQ